MTYTCTFSLKRVRESWTCFLQPVCACPRARARVWRALTYVFSRLVGVSESIRHWTAKHCIDHIICTITLLFRINYQSTQADTVLMLAVSFSAWVVCCWSYKYYYYSKKWMMAPCFMCPRKPWKYESTYNTRHRTLNQINQFYYLHLWVNSNNVSYEGSLSVNSDRSALSL